MDIRKIQVKKENGRVILSAEVAFGRSKKEIYFAVDEKFQDFIYADGSPFVAGLVLSAMKRGQDVFVEGSISEKLHHVLSDIRTIFVKWKFDFKNIVVKASSSKDMPPLAKGVGCFFSGGVDSFYTFLKNKSNANEAITHIVFIYGFDIELGDTQLLASTLKSMSDIAKREGVELILVETNIRVITDKYLTWGFAHGGALASVALFLRRGFLKIYIAGCSSWDELFPNGTHPDLDYLWSTEHLEIVHDGNEATRLDKVKKISKNKVVLDNLRVCFDNFGGAYNCGKCAKCLRTMVELEVAGALHDSKTLPTSIDPDLLRNLKIPDDNQEYFLSCLRALDAEKRNPELQKAVITMLERQHKFTLLGSVRKAVITFDDAFLNGQIGRHYYRMRKRLSRITS